MKSFIDKYDPFVDLANYERMSLCYSILDLELEAESTSMFNNQNKLHDIKMIFLMTSRLFLLTSALFGFSSLPVLYRFVCGWSISMMKFLTISGILFPVYFFLVYDRLAVHPKNIQLREFLKKYRSVLVKVISAQQKTKNVPTI